VIINPGTQPIENAREDLAVANLAVFLDAVRERGGQLDGEAVRDPAADRDGRFGWNLPMTGERVTRLLMPGVELARVRDDITAQAPCLWVNDNAWWWNDAVGMAIPLSR
jgi:hypothetical protein